MLRAFLFMLLFFLALKVYGQNDSLKIMQLYEQGNELSSSLKREGLAYLRQAAELSKGMPALKKVPLMANLCIGRYYMYTGNYDSAKMVYTELLAAAKMKSEPYFAAKANMGIGIIADYQSDYETSVNKNQEALLYFSREKDSVNIASALGNIGNSYIRLHSYQLAVDLFLKAIAIASTKNERRLTANLMSSLGRAYNDMGNKEKELYYKLKAYAIFKEINYTKGIATVAGNLGNYYEDANNFDSSMVYYNISLASSLKINDKGNIAIMYNNMADLFLKLNKPDKAMMCVDSALFYSNLSGDRLARSDALIEKAVLLKAAGKYTEGVAVMDKYISLKDSIYSDKMQAKVADMHVKYETEQKEHQIALLSRENNIQLLKLRNQQLVMDNKQAELIQQEQKLLIDQLEIRNKNEEIYRQRLEAQKKDDSIFVLKKRNTIQHLELINRQLQLSRRNLLVALFTIMLSALTLLVISFYKRNKLKREKIKKEAEISLQLAKSQADNNMQREKLRIGKELHDNIGSHLTFINTYLEQLSQRYTGDTNVTEARSVALNTLKELRNAIWFINQQEIRLDSFLIRIREYLQPLNNSTTTAVVDFRGDGALVLSPDTTTNIFRIIQEAVNNSIKHSDASQIRICIVSEDTLRITIEDNGRGFETDNIPGGNGLFNMKDRTENIGGRYALSSSAGMGTTINIELPINN